MNESNEKKSSTKSKRFVALIDEDLFAQISGLEKLQNDFQGPRSYADFCRKLVELGAIEYAKIIQNSN